MKKRAIIFLISLMAGFPSILAQEANNDTKTVIWGIKGYLGAELPTHWKSKGFNEKMYNSGFGASIGGLANIYLGKNFYFEPELALFYEGYSYDNVQVVAPNSPSVNVGPNIYKVGLRIPLDFGYFININEKWGLDIFTGPQFSYAFWGEAKSNAAEIKDNYNYMNLYKGDFAQRRIECSWKVGVGFPVQNFIISLEADFGLNNMLVNYHSFRENRVGLGITYFFPVETSVEE